ncbi:MAG: sugar phosphate isomerase/epimerase [Bacteroidota bacterium]
MKRRSFLKQVSAATAAGALVSACQTPDEQQPITLGVGLFTLPLWMERDFEGTLKKLADIGYKELEFYGPYSFSTTSAHASWDAITPSLPFSGSGYFGKTPAEVRALLDAYGLAAPAMHTDLDTLSSNIDGLGEAAAVVGHKYAGIAAIPEELRTSLDDYKRIAERFNEIGMRLRPYGIKFLYHNHGYGLVETEGEIPMQLLLEETEPAYVAMEMDVFWTIAGKADPITYLEAYPGRYKLMHVKDMTERVVFAGDGGKPEEWIGLFDKMADAGAGVLDLKGILAAAKKSGVDHYFLERDMAPDPELTLQTSYNNLTALAV